MKKGKKCHPSSREAMGLIESNTLTSGQAGSGKSIYIFPPLGGIEFSPCHQGREKLKRKSLKSC